MELFENTSEYINETIESELAELILSFKNLIANEKGYYDYLIEIYSTISEELKEQLKILNNNKTEDLLRFEIRREFLKSTEDREKNFFTITSKDDFSNLPTHKMNLNWGKSILYSPLNDHSRQHMKKGDVVFCYRQGQFEDLSTALDMRGIYAVGFVASDPIELFKDLTGHNRWAVEVCFPMQLEDHLKLRNIQLHPTTIDLTPYNGNRNDALQYISKNDHYETLLNLIYSGNIELKKYFQTLFSDYRFQEILLPEFALSNIYGNELMEARSVNNILIDSFIQWANKDENFQKSYKGILYNPILKSWDSIFFNDKIFDLDPYDLSNSYISIENIILDKTNNIWREFSNGVSNGAPAAILGKKNYLRFLKELVDNQNDHLELLETIKNNPVQQNESTSFPNTISVSNEFKILEIPANPITDEPRNQIVYGAPGTGKSFKLKLKAEKLFPDEWLRTRITFHPNYSYRNFVGSYKPMPLYKDSDKTIYSSDTNTKNKQHQKEPFIEYQFEPGPFLEMFIRAVQNPKYNFVIIIEEINRANTAGVFGDIFQLLDRNENGESEYSITLEPSAQDFLKANDIKTSSIKIPSNLYLWATMNSADQGVMPLDSAFKRRWSFEHIGLNENKINVDDLYINLPYLINNDAKLKWNEFRSTINQKLLVEGIHEDKLIGPFFLNKSEIKDDKSVKNKLLLYLKEDVLRYKSGLFNEELKSFSEISEAFSKGDNIFSKELEFKTENIEKSQNEDKANIEVATTIESEIQIPDA